MFKYLYIYNILPQAMCNESCTIHQRDFSVPFGHKRNVQKVKEQVKTNINFMI